GEVITRAGPDFGQAERRGGVDGFSKGFGFAEVTAGERDLDRLSPAAAEREYGVEAGDGAGIKAILELVASLVTEVAQLHEVIGVFGHCKLDQRIDAIGVFIAGELFAIDAQNSQRGVEG